MSAQPGDSSVKCQHAMQINCGLGVKIWATGTFKQHPAMCFQLPPPSTQHICSNVIWQTVMTKSLSLPVKWRSQALLAIHMHRFRLIVQVFNTHLSCFMQSRDYSFPTCIQPPHPNEQPQYVPPQVSERNRRLVRTPAWSLSVVYLCFDFMLVISPWSWWPQTTRLLPGGTMLGFQDFAVHWEGF